MDKYTSLELSKKLKNCGLESERSWGRTLSKYGLAYGKEGDNSAYSLTPSLSFLGKTSEYPAFDILNDICVKYAKEFFGEEGYYDIKTKKFTGKRSITEVNSDDPFFYNSPYELTEHVLWLLQKNQKQECEDYIWKHCLFNQD